MQKTTPQALERELAAIQMRNEQRAKLAIEQMGARYACHPSNLVKKDPVRTRFAPAAKIPALVTMLRKESAK